MASRVIAVHTEDEWKAKLSSGGGSFGGSNVVVVDFSAEWCGPCKMIGPVFEKLSAQYPQLTFIKVDVDELQDVAAEAGVRAMPTFQGYVNGAKAAEMVGADPKKLQSMLDELSSKVTVAAGQKLGGSSNAPSEAEAADDRRARMAAAAEARFKAAS